MTVTAALSVAVAYLVTQFWWAVAFSAAAVLLAIWLCVKVYLADKRERAANLAKDSSAQPKSEGADSRGD